jgi:hypothetical protein
LTTPKLRKRSCETSNFHGFRTMSFHQVQNPQLMNDAYFEMVLEKYDDLA